MRALVNLIADETLNEAILDYVPDHTDFEYLNLVLESSIV